MTTWQELPEHVRDAVEGHVGPVSAATEITVGRNSDLAAVLDTSAGRVFVKGVEGVSRRMRFLRNEITAGQLAAGIAPAVVFAEDVGEWLVVGFEYLPGRPADLSPGSPDLPHVAEVVDRLGECPAMELRSLRDRWGAADWWGRLAEQAPEVVQGWDVAGMRQWAAQLPELAHGDRLTHTDLHGEQFRIEPDGAVHVIDWGFPGAAAPWVDGAYLVLRLVEAGHEPGAAEAWAHANLTAFADITGEHLTSFAAYLAGMWTHWAVTKNGPGMQHRARLARNYAMWRLSAAPATAGRR
ncbi:hypothetical protein [Saccharopolyspora sp. NPDC050642]|uniref:phosphotransferase family protein n=1 Tax=Saccharopolyspora sp. NPDC050642 TaxID=3157099 RepID=UPI0033EBAD61